MVAEINDEGVVEFAGFFENGEEVADLGIEAAHAVVVVGGLLPKFSGVEAEVGKGFDVGGGERLFGESFYLGEEGTVGVWIVNGEEEGFVGGGDKFVG